MSAKPNKASVNRAIRHLGLQIQHKRGSGYFYFTSLLTDCQVGESVFLAYFNQQPLRAWVRDAEYALEQEAKS